MTDASTGAHDTRSSGNVRFGGIGTLSLTTTRASGTFELGRGLGTLQRLGPVLHRRPRWRASASAGCQCNERKQPHAVQRPAAAGWTWRIAPRD